jgi:adenosylcobinamide-GDP ribazoletransferase
MGRTMKDQAGRRELVVGTVTAVIVSMLIGGLTGVISLVTTSIVSFALVRFVMSRIPGLTGDIYGAICEICELVVLLIFVIT